MTGAALRPVTVIILTWNALDYTRDCLRTLAKSTHPQYDVIVVDNGSTDGTVPFLESRPGLRVIKNTQNMGFVRGNNQAIAAAPEGHDVILLNNDVVISQPDWIERLQADAYADPAIGVVGCRLVNGEGQLLHAGTYMPVPSYWGQQIGSLEKDIGQYRISREVEGVIGACMYIKLALLDKVGRLDEDYFSYFEDTDFCLRARRAGFKVWYCGDVGLVHRENTSTQVNAVDFNQMFRQSQQIFKSKWRRHLERPRALKVMWHSWIAANTGYAVSSRNLVLALDELGVDVRFGYVYGIEEPQNQHHKLNDIRSKPKDLAISQVVYGQGDVFYKNSGRYKIGYSMLEVSGIPDEWVRQANLLDEVWVPSTFNVETFAASGVKRPIKVMPLGVDPNYFNPHVRGFRATADRYTFASVFEWGERKAPELLLKAYHDEFGARDNVVLLLKVINVDPSVNVPGEIDKLGLSSIDAPPVVVLLNQEIPDYQMAAFYRSADCFVLPTRGEGWGMPTLEAMACGLPVISTAWSAQADFLRPDICYPLRVTKLVPARAKCPYYDGFMWAEPDVEQLRYLMRYAYEHREEAALKGMRASREVLGRWTWHAAARNIRDRLLEIETEGRGQEDAA